MIRTHSRSRYKNPAVGSGAPFTPLSLFTAGELGAWFDPSDMATLFQDDAGVIPVTAAGQAVGRMLDKSGNGSHATQPIESSKPLLRNSGGLWYLEFDGVDDFMATSAINFTVTDKISVFSGAQKLGDALGASLLSLGSNVNLNSFEMTVPASAGLIDIGFRISGTSTALGRELGAPVGVPLVITGLGDIGALAVADEVRVRLNGASSALSPVGSAGTGALGNSPVYIGRRGGATLPFLGYLFSVIIRGAASDLITVSIVESYTGSKSGIVI